MRRHFHGHPAHADAQPFTDFSAERQVVDVADLNVASMRGITHKTSIGLAGKSKNLNYRRAVTRRASCIFMPEAGLRKQDWAKSGQTCAEQLETVA
jgi:hypothetical protein